MCKTVSASLFRLVMRKGRGPRYMEGTFALEQGDTNFALQAFKRMWEEGLWVWRNAPTLFPRNHLRQRSRGHITNS